MWERPQRVFTPRMKTGQFAGRPAIVPTLGASLFRQEIANLI